jgi:hypothetical protein
MPISRLFLESVLVSPGEHVRGELENYGYRFEPRGEIPRFMAQIYDIYDPEGRPVNDVNAPESRRKRYLSTISHAKARAADKSSDASPA